MAHSNPCMSCGRQTPKQSGDGKHHTLRALGRVRRGFLLCTGAARRQFAPAALDILLPRLSAAP
eukprot:2362129-Prorocentrum_lima.AAC.1